MLSRLFVLVFLLLAVNPLRADVAVPPRVLAPESPAEAWNVIRLATSNLARLLAENRLSEIPVQASLCSPALRVLAQGGSGAEQKTRLAALTVSAFRELGALAKGAVVGDAAATGTGLAGLQKELAVLAKEFDEKAVRADIHQCPMHPDCVSPDPAAPCTKCGMDLLLRRIPYSFIYTTPGQPTVTLTATAGAPLTAGCRAEIKVRLKKGDGSPVLPADLLVMHTERIHLLIVDPTLGDYHHEHPVATATPGEYAFTFTPKASAPYRIFADLVPVASGVQEYPFADLPGAEKGGSVAASSDRLDSVVEGLRFQLAFDRAGAPPRAGEVRLITITAADAAGKPVTQLAPVMNAFAHLVGFYDDYRTVVHLHPEGGEITKPELRGGPTMSFRFYPPRAGHLRLYCQVLHEGRMIFAPFDVNVAP